MSYERKPFQPPRLPPLSHSIIEGFAQRMGLRTAPPVSETPLVKRTGAKKLTGEHAKRRAKRRHVKAARRGNRKR